MKNIFKMMVLAVAAVAVAVSVSCVNPANGFVEKGMQTGTNRLTINLDGQYLAKTILPTNFDRADLFYKLEGTSTIGTTLESIVITPDADGKATVDLAPASWTLTLVAYKTKTGDVLSDPVMIGKSTADLSNGGKEIAFSLKPYRTDAIHGDQLNGTVQIGKDGTNGNDFKFDADTTEVGYWVAGLYDLKTNKLIKNAASTPADCKSENNYATKVTSDDIAITWSDVPMGEYMFRINFYMSKADCDAHRQGVGSFSDNVIVIGGSVSYSNAINFTNFNKVPDAPTAFEAVLGNLTDADIVAGRYPVVFTWTDNSTNENGFILTITEIDAAGNEVAGSPLTQEYTMDNFTTSTDYIDGGLIANDTSATLYLNSGHLFKAELQSVNIVGTSDKVAYAPKTAAVAADTFAADYIGRTTIKYDPNNGTLNLSATESYDSIYYEQYTYIKAPDAATPCHELIALNDASDSYANAVNLNESAYASCWYLSTDNTQTAYEDHRDVNDITVKAKYDTTVLITVYQFAELDKNRITINWNESAVDKDAATVDFTFDPDNGTYTDSAAPATPKDFRSFYVKVSKADGTGRDRTSTECDLTVASNDTISILRKDYFNADGTWKVMVIAKDAVSGFSYSVNYYVTFIRGVPQVATVDND